MSNKEALAGFAPPPARFNYRCGCATDAAIFFDFTIKSSDVTFKPAFVPIAIISDSV